MDNMDRLNFDDDPVICAECLDVGKITEVKKRGRFLTCGLMNGRVIWNSKPEWCPKGRRGKEYGRKTGG